MNRRGWAALGMVIVAAPAGYAQQPILEVRLTGVGQTLVQARLSEDGVLELPADALEELTGEDLGKVRYVSIPALTRLLGPGVLLDYDANRALLLIRDSLGRLPATRAAFKSREARSRAQPTGFLVDGPYGSLTTESAGGRLIEGGWSFDRFAVGGAHSTESGFRWNASARLFERAYLTYDDGDGPRESRFGLRWAAGRTLLQGSYTPESGDLRAQAATSLGPWTLFLRQDGTAALSHRSVVQVTVGRTPDGVVTRVSFGRYHSPLAVPRIH